MSSKKNKEEAKKTAKEPSKEDIIKRLTEENKILKTLLWSASYARDGVLVVYKEHMKIAVSRKSFVCLGTIDDPKIIKVLAKMNPDIEEKEVTPLPPPPAKAGHK